MYSGIMAILTTEQSSDLSPSRSGLTEVVLGDYLYDFVIGHFLLIKPIGTYKHTCVRLDLVGDKVKIRQKVETSKLQK